LLTADRRTLSGRVCKTRLSRRTTEEVAMFPCLLVVSCLTVLTVVLPRPLPGRNPAQTIRLGVGRPRPPLTPFLPSGEEKPWFLDSPADQRTVPVFARHGSDLAAPQPLVYWSQREHRFPSRSSPSDSVQVEEAAVAAEPRIGGGRSWRTRARSNPLPAELNRVDRTCPVKAEGARSSV
jgi:hypothetical protein